MVNHVLLLSVIISTLFIMPIANAQEFQKETLQETVIILYDQKFGNSIITSIGFETTDNDEIKFSDELVEKINENKKIRSIVFTNMGECVIGVTSEEQCIMINFDYQMLKGDGGIRVVQDSAREMGSELIDELNSIFGINTKFHSVFIHTVDEENLLLETSGAVSGRGSVSAVFTTQKQTTDFLFSDIANRLISDEIRNGGGFYDILKEQTENEDSIISVTMIRNDVSNLFMFKISNEKNSESKDDLRINVLETLGIKEISRSDLFDGKNVPLNSIIQLIIIPEQRMQISAIATHAITDVTTLESISKKGWFFSKPAGDTIDGKFLFGKDKSASDEELRVEISPWNGESTVTLYSVEDIMEQTEEYESVEDFVKDTKNNEEEQSHYVVLVIIILVGIGAAIFYLKGYKPKR